MILKPIAPPTPIASFVKSITVIDFEGEENYMLDLFADGFPGIIYQQSEAMISQEKDIKYLESLVFHGLTLTPSKLALKGQKPVIIYQLYPHITKSLFGFSGKELADGCLDLTLLPTVSKSRLAEKLSHAKNVEAQLALINDFLKSLLLDHTNYLEYEIHYATGEILAQKGQIQIRSIRESLGMTERTFERKFENHVGVSPKLFAKITQFQFALNQLYVGGFQKLSDIALDNGYADQSHFIRNFRRFTGFTPKEFTTNTAPFVASN